jgi:hypothetical protein
VAGLDRAIAHAVDGALVNALPTGGFGYIGPGATGLTGAGILWMQLLGAANRPETKRSLLLLENADYTWTAPAPRWQQIYYDYYNTQAKFHASLTAFKAWNERMVKTLTAHQIVDKAALPAPDGARCDVGHWEAQGSHSAVMDTCLCTLQLEVYYRYLPTYKPTAVEAEPEAKATPDPAAVNVGVR